MGIFLKRQRTGEGSFYIKPKLRFVPFLLSPSSSQQHPPTPDFLVDSSSPCPWGTTRGRALRVARIPCAHIGAEQATPIPPSLPRELLAATKGSDNKNSLRAAFVLPHCSAAPWTRFWLGSCTPHCGGGRAQGFGANLNLANKV